MQWILIVLCLLLCVITGVQGYLLFRLYRMPNRQDTPQQKELQEKLFALQEEKLKMLSGQISENLLSVRESTELLSRQTEQRMQSFSQEIQTLLQQRLEAGQERQLQELVQIRPDIRESMELLGRQTEQRMQSFSQGLQTLLQQQMEAGQERQLQELTKMHTMLETRLTTLTEQQERELSSARNNQERNYLQTVQAVRQASQEQLQQLQGMQEMQQLKLDEMRQIVDEKMQQVLHTRMQQAFSSVNERLEQVYQGLGEMQQLAGSVGDLKKMFSNVKIRGEIGEIQLETILSDFLSEQQYVRNASVGTGCVEFAVRLPDKDGQTMLLPVDAKFPADTYQHLQQAYEENQPEQIREARKAFSQRIRNEAKQISEKYLQPPITTDFGILFLPTESLYAEAIRDNLPEALFRQYRIFLTSPSTLVALLTSLQAGFRSIAIQQQSNEVWGVLEEVRTEFNKFADALVKTQSRISSASEELEKLVGVRTRMMHKKLNHVQNYLTEQQE